VFVNACFIFVVVLHRCDLLFITKYDDDDDDDDDDDED
jgi:hypothetical protein